MNMPLNTLANTSDPVAQARFNMIEQQIRPWNVLDPEVLDLLALVRREDFVPPAYRGSPDIVTLDVNQMSELQRLLTRHGYDVGEIDGKFGTMTRIATKQAQIKAGLPADSYPTVELIDRLRSQTNGAASAH